MPCVTYCSPAFYASPCTCLAVPCLSLPGRTLPCAALPAWPALASPCLPWRACCCLLPFVPVQPPPDCAPTGCWPYPEEIERQGRAAQPHCQKLNLQVMMLLAVEPWCHLQQSHNGPCRLEAKSSRCVCVWVCVCGLSRDSLKDVLAAANLARELLLHSTIGARMQKAKPTRTPPDTYCKTHPPSIRFLTNTSEARERNPPETHCETHPPSEGAL